MDKKHTNSGPLMESADKHSIYTFIALCYKRAYGLASVPVPLRLTTQYLAYL